MQTQAINRNPQEEQLLKRVSNAEYERMDSLVSSGHDAVLQTLARAIVRGQAEIAQRLLAELERITRHLPFEKRLNIEQLIGLVHEELVLLQREHRERLRSV